MAKQVTDDQLQTWLASSNWRIKNSAVKIIGELKSDKFTDQLKEFISDNTPASFINRILGGDFINVGFVRRNSVITIRKIGITDDSIKEVLLKALKDPYWEVRSESIITLKEFYADNCPNDVIESIILCLQDKKFEVVEQTAYAVGKLSNNESGVNSLRVLYDHPNVLVKIAVVSALKSLHKRNIIKDKESLAEELSNIFIPGNHVNFINNI
ncbi:HEAT repeat domain-containing protein [candidate division KSB1 bacterium]